MGQRLARYFWALFLLAAVLPFLAACGKKTRPVPPEAVMPAPIKDLRYRLDEKGVTLSWSYPTRTVRGERLPYRVEGFELLRAVVPAKDYCEGCPVTFGPPVFIAAQSKARRETYRESLLRPRHRYIYQVRSKAGWLLTSAGSNTVSFLWDTPLQAPAGPRVTPGDRELTLSWRPPGGLLDDSPITGRLRYQIYRSQAGKDFTPLGDPVKETTFIDKQVRNGERYYYKVRAIRLHDGTEAGGMASGVVSGVPRDLAPPAPPQHVTAVKTGKGMELLWDAVPERDLAGYRIYRRLPSMAAPERIGEVGADRLTFIDTKPPTKEKLWYYSVTAFDRAAPPNESSFSRETAVGTID